MRKKGIWLLYSVLCLLLALSVAGPVFADAPPPMPHAFYGTVTINGTPAPAGTEVEARGTGVMPEVEGNPIETTVEGQYGSSSPLGPWLVVQGYIDEGTPIEFYVNEVRAQCYDVAAQASSDTYPFHSGVFTELNLSVGEAALFTAEAGGLYSGIVGATIALSGSASGGTAPYTYAWDLDNDGQYDDATGASPSHSWDTAGIHTIGLEVTDNVAATATDTATVTVTEEEEVFDPYIYDANEDGEFSYAETLAAVTDYLAGNITEAQALAVVKLYFG